jgi:hypothetical protein
MSTLVWALNGAGLGAKGWSSGQVFSGTVDLAAWMQASANSDGPDCRANRVLRPYLPPLDQMSSVCLRPTGGAWDV